MEIDNTKLELLDCQVEVVLKCLEYYCYSANFLLERNGSYTTKEDEMKISLITDTYNQIMFQQGKSRKRANLIKDRLKTKDNIDSDIIKKIS